MKGIFYKLLSHFSFANYSNSSRGNTRVATEPVQQNGVDRASRKSKDVTAYQIGDKLTGVVSGIEHYGLFVRLPNGESGLVFHNEICLPGEDISPRLGEQVSVVVIGFKPGRGLALSIRETRVKAAFDAFLKECSVGTAVSGTVKSVLDYGVFVNLCPGVAGLLHVSAIPNIHEYGKSSIGDPIRVRVVNIEEATQRVSLELL